MTRIAVAAALIPLTLAVVAYAPPALYSLIVAVVSLLALYEFFRIAERSNCRCFKAAGYLAAAATSLYFYLRLSGASRFDFAYLVVILVIVLFSLALAGWAEIGEAVRAISATFFGVFYTSYLLGFMIPLRYSFGAPEGLSYIFFLLGITWAGDSAAFAIGRNWGRTPLAPRISPRKTVEGSFASIGGNLTAAYLVYYLIPPSAIDLAEALRLAVILGVLGQMGDLAESVLKRGAGLKDSSGIIPGHGGMLDRIDSLLFAAPAMYIYLAIKHL